MTQICGLDFRSNLLSPCIPSSDATFLRHANCLDFSISLSPCVFQGASLSLSNTRFCATAMRRVWNNRILWTKACLQMDAKWIWGVKLKSSWNGWSVMIRHAMQSVPVLSVFRAPCDIICWLPRRFMPSKVAHKTKPSILTLKYWQLKSFGACRPWT